MNNEQRKLLTTTLERIEKDQSHWRQSAWGQILDFETDESAEILPLPHPCGTAYCFAGHVAIKTGYPDLATYIISYLDFNHIEPEGFFLSVYFDALDMWTHGRDVDGSIARSHIENYAKEKLGITTKAAARLFAPYNNLDDLRTTVENILRNDGDFKYE